MTIASCTAVPEKSPAAHTMEELPGDGVTLGTHLPFSKCSEGLHVGGSGGCGIIGKHFVLLYAVVKSLKFFFVDIAAMQISPHFPSTAFPIALVIIFSDFDLAKIDPALKTRVAIKIDTTIIVEYLFNICYPLCLSISFM